VLWQPWGYSDVVSCGCPLAEGGTMLRGLEDEDRDEAMTDAGEDTSEDSSDEDAE
jgi:hypothetical protein